jgi:type I restriction-modification system DNA methylase subunit
MSEELLQTIPQQIGKYTYYRLGGTTLGQLRDNGIIPRRSYNKLERKKPDGLAIYHGAIKAVVEYKQPSELQSEKSIEKAIAQEVEVARALCKILIVTDGSKSIWINALNGERIKDSQGNPLAAVFHPFVVRNTLNLEFLLDEVDASITPTNSVIRSAKIIDPSPLAARLWQTIWVATGKSPVKCLYNVVELFIFKFLSDLEVLDADVAFGNIYAKAMDNPENALEFYALNTRRAIYKLFPVGADGTTIINGTIFVNEAGAPNLSQAILFQRSLQHLNKYGEEFGSLTRIDKQFKTKLYESFLKQEVEALGQYFTPRKVIQSVIRMAGLDSPSFQFEGKRISDPFCGVGGFPLELLNMNESMRACYAPDRYGKINLPFALHGFDKGFERDDERTIILAKANMLIYLAEMLFRNPKCSKEFARTFNETFRLFKDNLGTFGYIIEDEKDKYDLILSNPPYVTSGSSIIKEEIQRTARTAKEYPINALGLEGLSVEWVVKSLKPNGRSFLIVPDGILGRVGDKKLRDYILGECYLNGIVSLPNRTFFANYEHTYILAITKKNAPEDVQTEPVFTYLVSNIGERLTSVRREEIEADDLPEMEELFKIYTATKGGSRRLLEQQSGRCRIRDIAEFRDGPHWVVDRWWTREERIAVGAEETATQVSRSDLDALVREFDSCLAEHDAFMAGSARAMQAGKPVALGDEALFRLFIGKRVLRKDVTADTSKVPVYSANVFEPMGYRDGSNIEDFEHPSILWGIDGNFAFSLIPPGTPFASTDHCGVIQILTPDLLPDFLLYAMYVRRFEESFDRSFRASLANMRRFVVTVPVDAAGAFDVQAQQELAVRYRVAQDKAARLQAAKAELDAAFSRYLAGARV